jgi:hypothetical protein
MLAPLVSPIGRTPVVAPPIRAEPEAPSAPPATGVFLIVAGPGELALQEVEAREKRRYPAVLGNDSPPARAGPRLLDVSVAHRRQEHYGDPVTRQNGCSMVHGGYGRVT